MSGKPQKYSVYALIICVALMTYANMGFYPRWNKEKTESNIAWDVEGYYWYLPSIFVYKNLKKQEFDKGVLEKIQASQHPYFENGFKHEASGNYVLKYTSGMAILYSPAFFVGHYCAGLLGYEQSGFSAPYKLAFQLWGLLFSLIGLYYLRKLLLLFYEDAVVAIVLLLLVLGSNYLNYAAIDIGMSHSWLFTLYVLLLLNTYRFYESLKTSYAIKIGFLMGLMTLIRPTEVISVLVPLLWGIASMADFKARLRFLLDRWQLVLLVGLCFGSMISIQLFYWHYVSGDWIVYSYQDQGFNFIRPHAIVYSWSYRAGWLRYSPMMLLAYVGLIPFLRNGKNKWMILLMVVLNYYIVSAWNIWDYGGFSGRAMIQSYPILLFPFASLLTSVKDLKMGKWVYTIIALFFVYINIWWTYQAHWGGLADAFYTTKEYYWKMFGKWSLADKYQKLKDTDELLEQTPLAMHLIYKQDNLAPEQYCISRQHPKSDTISIAYQPNAAYNWIRVAADFHCQYKEWSVWQMPQFVVQMYSGANLVKSRFIRTDRFLDNGQNKNIFLDVKMPDEPIDRISVGYVNIESEQVSCMERIEVYELKAVK